MQLLYLDSYYFYAPIPRVVNLRHKLSQYGLRNYKLLYGGFSGPRYFVQHFTQTFYGETITSIPSLHTQQRELKPGKGFQKLLNALKGVFSGRTSKRCIRLEKLIKIVGDERANIIDFTVFILRNADAEDKISHGYCYSECIEIDRNTAEALYNLVKIEALIKFFKRHTNLYKLYENYILCKTCQILGLKYPYDVIPIEGFEEYTTVTIEALCNDCRDLCIGHHDDMKRAEVLLLYAERSPSANIHIATVATVTRPEKFYQECFSCLAKCIEKKVNNIVVLY